MVGAVETGTSLIVETEGSELTNTHYRLNQLLKVTELFPSMYDGKYANLRRDLRLQVSPRGIIIKPVALKQVSRAPEEYGSAPVPSVSGGVPDEGSALSYLASFKGTMPMVRFKASEGWDRDKWISQVEKMGYLVHGFQEDEAGMTIVAVERQGPKSAFDLIGG